jgi:hypothetical protein
MNDPRIIALSSNPGQVEPGPFSEPELREQWNAQADQFNQWESLDSSEQLAWAQTRAIAAAATALTGHSEPDVGHILRLAEIIEEVDLRNHSDTFVLGAAALAEGILAHPGFSGCHDGPAALPAPAQGEGWSDQEIIDLADFDAGFDRYDTKDESGNEGVAWECSNSQLLNFARLVRQGRPSALPVPGEVEELVSNLDRFIVEYGKMGGLHPESIYSIQEGIEGREAHLRISSLARISELLKGIPHA